MVSSNRSQANRFSDRVVTEQNHGTCDFEAGCLGAVIPHSWDFEKCIPSNDITVSSNRSQANRFSKRVVTEQNHGTCDFEAGWLGAVIPHSWDFEKCIPSND